MLLRPFELHTPKTLESALALYGSLPEVRLQAGGTFLVSNLKVLKKRGVKTPQNIISLTHINELNKIELKEDQLVIGAMVNIDDIYNSSLLTGNLSLLRAVARYLSSQLIRNMATIGGNLTCRYAWTEMPVVAVTLEAQMHFKGKKGEKEIVYAQDFFKNMAKTDKILTHVTIQKDAFASVAYFRARKSPYVDVPLLSLAIKTKFIEKRFTETIVAVNNGIAFVKRDFILEDFLNKSCMDDNNILEESLKHLEESIYDTRGSDYKKHMFHVGIQHALRDLIIGKII